MKKLMLILPLIFISPILKGDQLSIVLGGYSHLFKDTTQLACISDNCTDDFITHRFNKNHNTMGIKYNNFSIVKFNNHFNNNSYLIAYSYKLLSNDKRFLGLDHNIYVSTGLITGYYSDRLKISDNISLYLSPTIESTYNFNENLSVSVETSFVWSNAVTFSASINYKF